MKLLFTSILAGLTLLTNAQDITNGLVAKYSFDNQDISDQIGSINGTNLGATFSSGYNGNGNSISFSGFDNDQIAFVEDPIISLTTDYTISHWFMLDQHNVGEHQYTISSRIDSSGNSQGGVDFLINKNDSTLSVTGRNIFTTIYSLSSTTKLQEGVWYHVVIAKNTNGVKLFLNGVQEAWLNMDFSTSDVSDPYFWNIGCVYGGLTTNGLQRELWGSVDEVRFYNRCLSDNEVSALLIYEQTVSIEENDLDVTIYPNPTNGIINLSTAQMENVEVYSLTGQLIFQKVLEGDNHLNVEFLPNGAYFVKLTQGNHSKVIKLIKEQ